MRANANNINQMMLRRTLAPSDPILALFANGEQGLLYRRAQSYFADNGLTTPAGPTEPIQAYKDLSPNAFHLTANSSSNRPINDGGIARYDGVDDGVDRRSDGTDPYGAVDDSHIQCIYISGAADQDSEQMICGGVNSSSGWQVRVLANSDGSVLKVRTGSISAVEVGSTSLAGGSHIITIHWDRPNHRLIARIDGAEEINSVITDADRTALTRFTLGARLTDFGGSSGLNGLIGDMLIVARPLGWSASEIAQIESDFAAGQGVTL